jgi:hypothetical protein
MNQNKIGINIEKKNLYILAGVLSILGIFTVFAAVDTNLGFHPLQQVTTDQTGAVSVDANSNSIIDEADNANSLQGTYTAFSFCKGNGADCVATGGVDTEDFCKSDGTDCPSTAHSVNSDLLGGISKDYLCKVTGLDCPDLAGDDGLIKFGGFYSKTGSTCNVLNPATAACLCPVGYEDTLLDSSKHICWAADWPLPSNPLFWTNPGVWQSEYCAYRPFTGIHNFGPCNNLGETSTYYISTEGYCGEDQNSMMYIEYIQTCTTQ